MDEEIRQALNEVREMKQMCGNINMKLTNIVTQRGQNWKEKLEAEYQRGLEDGKKATWEAVRKVIHLPEGVVLDLFTDCYSSVCTALQVFLKYEGSEVIEKLKAYEEKHKADEEIKVGDEVEVLNSGSKYLVAWIAGTSLCGFAHDGVTCRLQPSDVRKTGRHFDIKSILEAMKHD